jgi:hypothetical protein
MLVKYVKRASNGDILEIPYAVNFTYVLRISRRKLHEKGRYLKQTWATIGLRWFAGFSFASAH